MENWFICLASAAILGIREQEICKKQKPRHRSTAGLEL
jgi:hypothetical protein